MAFDRSEGILIVAAEARNQPHLGKQGVAASLFNRLKTGRYGKSIAHICLARKQYSSMNDDRISNGNLLAVADLSDDDPAIVDCALAYDEAAAGEDPVLGATHYYDTSIAPPYWTEKQPNGRQAIRTVQIARLVFYRDVP